MYKYCSSVVIPTADNFLHCGSQEDRVLLCTVLSHIGKFIQENAYKLCRHCSLDITQRWIVLDYTLLDQVVKLQKRVRPSILYEQRALTAIRYLDSPTRSRYLGQNGNVPKLVVIDFSKDLADVNL